MKPAFLERVLQTKANIQLECKTEGTMKYNHMDISVHIDSRPEDLWHIYMLKSTIEDYERDNWRSSMGTFR